MPDKPRIVSYSISLKQKSPISPTSATMYALVEAFDSVDDIVYASLEDIAAFVDKHSRSHFSNSKTIATAIKQAADMSYHLPKTVNNSINQAIAISLASIRELEKQIKMLDKAIEENFRVIPNTLTFWIYINKVDTNTYCSLQ